MEDSEKEVSPGGSWGLGATWVGSGVFQPLGEPGRGPRFTSLERGGYAALSVSVGDLGEVSQFLYAFVRCVISLHSVEQISSFLSPSSQLVKLAKRLKKEKVNVDIINFGEEVSKDWLRALT